MKVLYKPTHKEKLEDPMDFILKSGRGAGSPKPGKGKGSYRRKEKYNKKLY